MLSVEKITTMSKIMKAGRMKYAIKLFKRPSSFGAFLTVFAGGDGCFVFCFTGGTEGAFLLGVGADFFFVCFGTEDGFCGLTRDGADFFGSDFFAGFPLAAGGFTGFDAACLRAGDLSLHLQ